MLEGLLNIAFDAFKVGSIFLRKKFSRICRQLFVRQCIGRAACSVSADVGENVGNTIGWVGMELEEMSVLGRVGNTEP